MANICSLDPTWFAAFIEHVPAMAFIKDVDGRYVYLNQAYEEYLQVDPESRLGKTDQDLWPPSVARALMENDREVIESGQPMVARETIYLPGRTLPFHHLVSKFPLRKDGNIVALGGFALDITRQVEAEEALKQSEDLYRVVAEYTYDCEMWKSPDGRMRYVSPSCERITGYPPAKFLSDPDFLRRTIHPDDLPGWDLHMEKLELGAEASLIEYRVVRPDGKERWVSHFCQRVYDRHDTFLGFRSSGRDVTDRKLIEMQLKHQAFHDPLTGLPNRSLCLDRISQALERSKRRENYHYAVIFLDLDRFKVINDSLGHNVGDQVLVETASRLARCVRTLDTVARLGGDEFVIVLEEISSAREAIRIIRRLRQEMSQPFTFGGHDIHLTASLGIVLSPAIYEKPEDLLRNANIAMHRAKELGRNKFKVFHSRMLEQAIQMLGLELDLRRGLENGEFHVQYQPIISLKDKSITGFEALARWRHPSRGAVSPAEFIPAAEETGLIIPLGRHVLAEATKAMARWRDDDPQFAELTINVNLSAKQLSQPDLVEQVQECLRESGLPGECLKLEITESVLMENAQFAVVTLKRLKDLGVKLSIDDFGTGYSSLSYLQQFPVDTLKVDQGFINKMECNQENQEIVRAVIALAHSLGLDVVAEGVEKEGQLSILSELACGSGQGFLFSRPMDPEQVLKKFFIPVKK